MCDLYTKIWERFKAKRALMAHILSTKKVKYCCNTYIKYHVPILWEVNIDNMVSRWSD